MRKPLSRLQSWLHPSPKRLAGRAWRASALGWGATPINSDGAAAPDPHADFDGRFIIGIFEMDPSPIASSALWRRCA